MKFASLLSVLLLVHTVAFGRDSAYKALRTLGNQRSQSVLNHVIEVQGHAGTPQPPAWKIVLDDPAARGGVREFEIEKGNISSERTPVRSYSGSAEGAIMNFQKLNLDSDGAFAVANKEANKAQVGFDSVDYVLRTDDETRNPVWVLRLLDAGKHNVGTIRIAANDGRVLMREGFGAHQVTQDEPAPDRAPPDTGDADSNPQSGDQRVGHTIKKSLVHAGASVEEFFTGHRTLEKNYGD